MSSWAAIVEVGVLSVALALDAAAVSAGLGAAGNPLRTLVRAAAVFAVFQAGMAAGGALGGSWLAANASAWDHWVAFGLLVLVGGNMLSAREEEETPEAEVGWGTLLALGVATSIDALAAGVTLPLFGVPLWASLGMIGGVTLGLSGFAAVAGRRVGTHLGPRVQKVGGVVLLLIGARILIQHLLEGA